MADQESVDDIFERIDRAKAEALQSFDAAEQAEREAQQLAEEEAGILPTIVDEPTA